MPSRSNIDGGGGCSEEPDNAAHHITDPSAIHFGDDAGGCLTGNFPNPMLVPTGVPTGKYTRATVGVALDGRIVSIESNVNPVGSQEWPCKLVDSDYVLSVDDGIVLIDATKKDLVVTLPDASKAYKNNITRLFFIRKVDRSVNTVLVKAVSGQAIDRRNSLIKLTLASKYVGLLAYMGEWFVFSSDSVSNALVADTQDNYGAVRRVLCYDQPYINAGRAVAAVGFDIAHDCMLITEASANEAVHPAIGVTASRTTSDTFGVLVIFGIVTGIDTSHWQSGDPLYVSNDARGILTNQRPSGDANFKVQQIARVVSVDDINGTIDVGMHQVVDLPLLRHNHVWVGNNSAVPTSVPTSKLPRARHAATHVAGGWDEFNGDKLLVTHVPEHYDVHVFDDTVEHSTQMLAHIKGIDKSLGLLFNKLRNLENK